jgi:periplasmic protein TonB
MGTVDRRFGQFLLASLAMHGLVMFALHGPRMVSPETLPPITLELRLLPEAAPVPVPPKPLAQPSVPDRPVERKPVLTSDKPAPARPAEPVAPVAPPALATAPATSSTPAPAPLPEVRMPAPPVVSQADLLADYRQRLGALLARQHEYPRLAAMRGWEGEVMLRVRVARKGNLLAVQLDRSSGFDVLDQHALAMLERLGGFPPLPDDMQASEIQVVVPVSYKLKKQA